MKKQIFTSMLTLISVASFSWSEAPESMDAKIKRGNEIISRLERAVVYFEEKSSALTDEIIKVDERVEQNIQGLVETLASLKDSEDSGTRIENNKVELIEALKRSISFYQKRRSEKETELMQVNTRVSKEDLKSDMNVLDERTGTRIDQIMELTSSFTQNEDYNKYVYKNVQLPGNNRYRQERKISGAYKHNKKVTQVGELERKRLIDEIQVGVDKLVRENTILQNNLRGALDHADYELRLDEIERNEGFIEELSLKISALAEPDAAPKEIQAVEDSEEAHGIDIDVRNAVKELQTEFRSMMAKKTQLDLARSKLHTAKIKLAYNQKVMDKLVNP